MGPTNSGLLCCAVPWLTRVGVGLEMKPPSIKAFKNQTFRIKAKPLIHSDLIRAKGSCESRGLFRGGPVALRRTAQGHELPFFNGCFAP